MRWERTVRAAAAAVFLLAGGTALAHETLHEVQRGKAIAVRAYFVDGEVLAYTAYEVYSPADPKVPWQKGRTDRAGWLAFVPNAPGKWRVKVIDTTGHGLDLEVDGMVGPGNFAVVSAVGTEGWPMLVFILRPLLGLLAIGIIFAALILAYRKKGREK